MGLSAFMILTGAACTITGTENEMSSGWTLFWLIVLPIGCLLFGLIFPNQFIIVGTSFVGALDLVSGIGILFQQFPYPKKNMVVWIWWTYFACFLIVWFIGLIYQYRTYKQIAQERIKRYGIAKQLD